MLLFNKRVKKNWYLVDIGEIFLAVRTHFYGNLAISAAKLANVLASQMWVIENTPKMKLLGWRFMDFENWSRRPFAKKRVYKTTQMKPTPNVWRQLAGMSNALTLAFWLVAQSQLTRLYWAQTNGPNTSSANRVGRLRVGRRNFAIPIWLSFSRPCIYGYRT